MVEVFVSLVNMIRCGGASMAGYSPHSLLFPKGLVHIVCEPGWIIIIRILDTKINLIHQKSNSML